MHLFSLDLHLNTWGFSPWSFGIYLSVRKRQPTKASKLFKSGRSVSSFAFSLIFKDLQNI